MKLYTTTQYKQLLKNGNWKNVDRDFKPVIKYKITGTDFFCYITKINPDNKDEVFGFRNRQGVFHHGWFRLTKLVKYEDEFHEIERDMHFKATETLDDIVNRCRRTTGIEIIVG